MLSDPADIKNDEDLYILTWKKSKIKVKKKNLQLPKGKNERGIN